MLYRHHRFPFPEEDYPPPDLREHLSKAGSAKSQHSISPFWRANSSSPGGNIKNVFCMRLFWPPRTAKLIGMPELIRATKREFQKMADCAAKPTSALLRIDERGIGMPEPQVRSSHHRKRISRTTEGEGWVCGRRHCLEVSGRRGPKRQGLSLPVSSSRRSSFPQSRP